jgi:hypothetical protein
MLKHRSRGRRPQVTFAAGFHETIQGDLIPGPCILRYNPWRIVPAGEILSLSESQRPIYAHVNFHPVGGGWESELRLRHGSLVEGIYDPTSQEGMIEAEFLLPTGCEELECWFSYVDASGQTHWDSAMGANFRLRFPTHDLRVMRGEIVKVPGIGVDRLEIELESVPAVEAVDLRYRFTQPSGQPGQQCTLVSSADHRSWTTPAGGEPVPSNSTIVFDLVYSIGGRKFTDDNEGTWFLAN